MVRTPCLPLQTARLFAFTCLALAPNLALAQPAGPAHFSEAAVAPADADDQVVWNLGLGGMFAYGNARSFQMNATSHFLVRRQQHQLTFDISFLYGVASLRDATTQSFGNWNANAQNFNGRLRYDLFLTPDDALFAVVAGTNNPFAGLDFRFQGQLGYMRNLFVEHNAAHTAQQRLWMEVGADLTYDDRYPNPLCAPAPMGVTLDRSTCLGSDTRSYLLPNDELQPSGRVFLGYDNHLNSDWSYATGVEALIDVRGDPHWRNVRVTWRNALTLNVGANFAVNLQFVLLYDGEPVPGFQELDTQTTLGLTYTMLSPAPTPPPACP